MAADTQTRILNQAERLFARNGYRDTSLRELTDAAKVNLAAVNYHFKSKQGLLRAVLERRLKPLNQLRQQRLNQVLESARERQQKPETGALVSAFVQPTFDFRASSRSADNFIALVGRVWDEADDSVRHILLEQTQPLLQLLARGLAQALPQIPENILNLRILFFLGSMGYVMKLRDVPPLLDSHGGQPDQEDLNQQFIKFIIAGLEAPL